MQQHREDGTCKTCNKQFGPGHSCYSAGGSSGSSGSAGTKVLRAMTRRPKLDDVVTQILESEAGARVLQGRAADVRAPGVVRPPWSSQDAASVSGSPVAAGRVVNVEEISSVPWVAGPSSFSAEESGAVEVDTDTVMSESTDADGKEELSAAAQETFVGSIDHISVRDADVVQNIAAQQCKFDAVFSASPSMHSNSICVPIVVQNVVCFGIVDTGATFSCITNEVLAYLGGSSLSGFAAAAEDSVVQLGHEVSTIACVGSCCMQSLLNVHQHVPEDYMHIWLHTHKHMDTQLVPGQATVHLLSL